MTSTGFLADDIVNGHIAGWLRHLGAVRRLATKTLEAYQRDLSQFVTFLAGHTGGAVSLTSLSELWAAVFRAFLAVRRQDGVEARSLARSLSASRASSATSSARGCSRLKRSTPCARPRPRSRC